jgi:hypothetical protein
VIARSGNIRYCGIAHSGLANLEDWSNCKIVYCGPRKKIALPTSGHYKKKLIIFYIFLNLDTTYNKIAFCGTFSQSKSLLWAFNNRFAIKIYKSWFLTLNFGKWRGREFDSTGVSSKNHKQIKTCSDCSYRFLWNRQQRGVRGPGHTPSSTLPPGTSSTPA